MELINYTSFASLLKTRLKYWAQVWTILQIIFHKIVNNTKSLGSIWTIFDTLYNSFTLFVMGYHVNEFDQISMPTVDAPF